MSVAQAIYGAVGKGHSLIAASPGAATLAPRIVGRTDLPNTAPPGVQWTRYESLFVHDGHLCVSRTWPDPTAERAGMVFTHALLVPWAEAGALDDLNALATLLPAVPLRTQSLTELDIAATSVPSGPTGHDLMLMDAMLGSDDAHPIVWLGETGLLEAVAEIWRFLPGNLRKGVSLRISFGPDDVQANPPRFVSTPRSLTARWQGRTVIDPSVPAGPTSEVSRSLMLDAPAQSISAYAARYTIDVKSIRELALLQQSWSLAQAEPRSYASKLGELRLLLRLAPGTSHGAAAKRDVVKGLADAVVGASAEEVLRLRNVAVADWGADDVLWPAVEAWAQTDATRPRDTTLWVEAAGTGAQTPWTTSVWKGFGRAFKTPSAEQCAAWWAAMEQRTVLVAAMIEHLSRSSKVEASLASAYPAEASPALSAEVMQAARAKGWPLLHAYAARALPRLEAVEAQLGIDRDAASTAGLDVLLSDASASETIAAALRFPDLRLIARAGDACAHSPSAVADFDITDAIWRQIMAHAAKANPEIVDGLRDIGAVRTAIVESLAASAALEPSFLEAVGDTSLADLSDLPNLEAIWPRILIEARALFLQRTAEAWLARLARDVADPSTIGATLRRAIVSDGLRDRFLFGSSTAPASAMRYFDAFGEIGATTASRWLQHLFQNKIDLDRPVAEQFGRLVRKRSWYGVASAIINYVCVQRWRSLAPAVPAIRSMLGPIDLTLLFMTGASPSPPSADEVWTAFEHIAAELYGDGPSDDELWSRAGGKVSKLPGGKTGAARWHNAMKLLKRGGASITGRDLLREMLRERPRNEQLLWLAKQNWLGD